MAPRKSIPTPDVRSNPFAMRYGPAREAVAAKTTEIPLTTCKPIVASKGTLSQPDSLQRNSVPLQQTCNTQRAIPKPSRPIRRSLRLERFDLRGFLCSFSPRFFAQLLCLSLNEGALMRIRFGYMVAGILALGATLSGNSRPAAAADLGLVTKAPVGTCTEIVFTCDNGHHYPLCPRAVSVEGEVVTASLLTGRGGVHVRLVPMGVGYRYAGRGIWLDGFQENALLNFGKHRVACSIARS